jgi:segregation and condensation protein A
LELTNPCLVKLQTFEGPLDLLLHLIKRSEIDIYDIPIAMITEQYLEYLEMMRELNLEVAGDYLVIAAELGFIKSRMLLPKLESDGGVEEGDPRAELVRRLIEYQRYKEAVRQMLSFEILGRDVFVRVVQFDEEELDTPSQFIQADLWALIDAFREVYRRRSYSWADHIEFSLEALTLEQKMEEVVKKIETYKSIPFEYLFDGYSSRHDVVLTFLAVLELVKNSVIGVLQVSSYSSIQLVYLGDDRGWSENT